MCADGLESATPAPGGPLLLMSQLLLAGLDARTTINGLFFAPIDVKKKVFV